MRTASKKENRNEHASSIEQQYCYCQVTSVVSYSVRPHRWQPTRLPCPWDSPGKNTGVGCHFLLQCMKVKGESEVAQSHPTLSHPRDGSLPDSSVHGICQARVLEWGAIAFSEQSIQYIINTDLDLKHDCFHTKIWFILTWAHT